MVFNSEKVVPIFRYLLTPLAATGYALALWRLGEDLNFAGKFFVTEGLLSRWQVWLALGIATQMAARQLNRRTPEARS